MQQTAPVEPTKGVLRMPRPPQDSKLVGQTPHGQNLYEREIVELVRDADGHVKQEPMKGPDGEDLWIKHPTTGVPIRPRMRNVTRRRKQQFIIHVEVNSRGVATGNHTIVEWDAEAQNRVETREQVARNRQLRDQFFERAAARGMSPDEILDRLESLGATQEPEDELEAALVGATPPEEPEGSPLPPPSDEEGDLPGEL